LQWFVLAQASEHLPAKNRKQEKEQDRNFEVIGMCRSDLGKVIKTPREKDRAAKHSCDFEIGQALVIQHLIKFPEPDHSEQADQQPKQDLVTCEHDQQSDCPKRDRTDEPQNKSGTGRNDVCPSLLKRGRHALHHLEGKRAMQARARVRYLPETHRNRLHKYRARGGQARRQRVGLATAWVTDLAKQPVSQEMELAL
jgi:hypothetical protein